MANPQTSDHYADAVAAAFLSLGSSTGVACIYNLFSGRILFPRLKAVFSPLRYTVFHYACSVSRYKFVAFISFIDGRFKRFCAISYKLLVLS